uniref:2-oxoacid:acceptor oxidoreductase subunit alpha n=1 Tax=candidate division WOR-3 bacterium TaxID=2052148 RepID=A0A7C4U791_UNCW3
MGRSLVSGNEAIALGALKAGLKFYAGYPITPSSDIAEILAKELPKYGGRFIQMEDEIASMGAIIGASLAGLKTMTATSGPGFSLMLENIGFGIMVEAPCVIVDVQRGGPSTGLPTFPAQGDLIQARWGTHGDHEIIVIYPNSVMECFELTVKAFNLAEVYRTPVVLLSDEIIAHLREIVEFPENVHIVQRRKPEVPPEEFLPYTDRFGDVPPMPDYGSPYRYHTTGLAHDETGFPIHHPEKVEKLLLRITGKITKNRDKIGDIEILYPDAENFVFALGCVSRGAAEVVEYLREKGINIGLIRPRVLFPFPETQIRRVCDNAKRVFVFEMNHGQIIHVIRRVVKTEKIRWFGKSNGEIITPEEMEKVIMEGLNGN